MKKSEELEKVLESICEQYNDDCGKCPMKKECEELERLWKQEEQEKGNFKAGQLYRSEDSNIFIKRVSAGMVVFIEGYSPTAIHDIQEIPAENLLDYMNRWGFRFVGNY